MMNAKVAGVCDKSLQQKMNSSPIIVLSLAVVASICFSKAKIFSKCGLSVR